jgi:WD40 repeat protein
MSQEYSLLFSSFCFLMEQLKSEDKAPSSEALRRSRLVELHQQTKSVSWDKDGAAWARFLRGRGHLIVQGGAQTLLSEALSEAETSPVTQVAEAYLKAGLWKGKYLRPAHRPLIPAPTAVRRTFVGHEGPVMELRLTPQGLLSASHDGTLRLWSIESGELLRTFQAEGPSYQRGIATFVLLDKGKQALSLGSRRILRWDLETGEILDEFEASDNDNFVLAVHPNEESFVDSNFDGDIFQRDLRTGEVIRVLKGHTYRIVGMTFLPDGRLLSGCMDGNLRVWEVETGRCLHEWGGHQKMLSIALYKDNIHALSGDQNGSLFYSDVQRGKRLRQLCEFGIDHGFISLAFSPDGKRALSGEFSGVLRLWDLASGQELQRFYSSASGMDVILWHQENQALVGNRNGDIVHFDLTGSGPPNPERHSDNIVALCAQSHGPSALSGSFDGTLLLWDVPTGRLRRRLIDGPARPLYSLAVHPSRPLGLSSAWDRVVSLWDLKNGELLHQISIGSHSSRFATFLEEEERILALWEDNTLRAFSLEGAQLWSASEVDKDSRMLPLPGGRVVVVTHKEAKVWDLKDGALLGSLPVVGAYHLALHPDGQRLLAISEALKIVQLSSKEILCTIPVKSRMVRFGNPLMLKTGVILPDGERLLHGDEQGLLSLWSLTTGAPLGRWEAHAGEVHGLAMYPDGRVVSTGDDRRVIVWDVEARQPLATWQLEADCCTLTVTPNDRLLCSDSVGRVLLLDLMSGSSEVA